MSIEVFGYTLAGIIYFFYAIKEFDSTFLFFSACSVVITFILSMVLLGINALINFGILNLFGLFIELIGMITPWLGDLFLIATGCITNGGEDILPFPD